MHELINFIKMDIIDLVMYRPIKVEEEPVEIFDNVDEAMLYAKSTMNVKVES